MGSNIWDLCIQGLESKNDYPREEISNLSDISYPYHFRKGLLQEENSDLRGQNSIKDPETLALNQLCYQSQAIHFLAEMQYAKRASMKSTKETKDIFEDSDDEEIENRRIQILKMGPTELCEKIKDLPPTWRIVQIGIKPNRNSYFRNRPKNEPNECPALFLSRASSSEGLDTLTISPPSGENGMNLLMEHHNIMHLHNSIYQATNKEYTKKEFSEMKKDVDARIDSLIETMEKKYLQHGAAWMLGQPCDQDRIDLLEKMSNELLDKEVKGEVNRREFRRLSLLLDASNQLSEESLYCGLRELNLSHLFPQALQFRQTLSKDRVERHPIILILDPDIQQLPWDALPIIGCNPVSRVPSLHFLLVLYEKHKGDKNSVLKSDNHISNDVYYVLNPDQNLGRTQDRLENLFKEELRLEGSIGEHPSLSELERVLHSKDGFMYCGHGSVLKNLPAQKLESMNIRAMPLLLGCKSGKLERIGRTYDPMGTANSYMIATAPVMLGFLWSITDKDVDEWTASFLRFWFEEKNRTLGLVESVCARKNEFSKRINGASTVLYGLPRIR